jgi:hypothetical protein
MTVSEYFLTLVRFYRIRKDKFLFNRMCIFQFEVHNCLIIK